MLKQRISMIENFRFSVRSFATVLSSRPRIKLRLEKNNNKVWQCAARWLYRQKNTKFIPYLSIRLCRALNSRDLHSYDKPLSHEPWSVSTKEARRRQKRIEILVSLLLLLLAAVPHSELFSVRQTWLTWRFEQLRRYEIGQVGLFAIPKNP